MTEIEQHVLEELAVAYDRAWQPEMDRLIHGSGTGPAHLIGLSGLAEEEDVLPRD